MDFSILTGRNKRMNMLYKKELPETASCRTARLIWKSFH